MQVELFEQSVTVTSTQLIDMPVSLYYLSGGRRKRRVDAAAVARVVRSFFDRQDTNRTLHVVLERPTPIPAIDGWQSAALSCARPTLPLATKGFDQKQATARPTQRTHMA